MFKLIDTLNARTISSHRTLDAAVRAQFKHSKAVKKANGQNSFIPTKIAEIIEGEEVGVDYDTLVEAKIRIGA